MLKLVISTLALEEENEIWTQIKALPAPDSGQKAFDLLSALQNTYCTIARSPGQQKVPGLEAYLCPVEGLSRYTVLYRFDNEFIEILHILRFQSGLGLAA